MQLAAQLQGVVYLVVVDDGVDGDVDLCVKLVCVGTQFGNVLYGVAGRRPGSEAACSDVDGIRSVVYCRFSTFKVFGW